jgi:transposase
MNHIEGVPREQVLMFPEVVEDYVSGENPVRFIDAFVEGLELVEHGFQGVEAARTGRPGYHAGDLLRLYIYGYLNRVRSSRLLERETQKNIEVIWLLRKLQPDFKTISDFRKDNTKAIKRVCKEFTLLCAKLELFGGELFSIDGSKFAAVNGNGGNYSEKKLKKLLKQVEEKTEQYLKDLEQADSKEPVHKTVSKEELQAKIQKVRDQKGRYEGLLQQLSERGLTQISLTDEESRMMKTGQGRDMSYNVQTVVDQKHKLIVEHAVTNAPNDMDQLSHMGQKAKETLGLEKADVLADAGYYNATEIKKCVDSGLTPYVPKPSARQRDGVFGKESFRFDAKKDCYHCPAGQELTRRFSSQEKEGAVAYYSTTACCACPLRSQCTQGKTPRRIKRFENDGLMEAMAIRIQNHPEKMPLRSSLSEHPFGTIKRAMNAHYFLMKGLEKVGAEMSLSVLAYNLKRAINILGVPALLGALA